MSLFTKPLISVVISVLVVVLIYGSFTPFIAFAVPPTSGFNTSNSCKQQVATLYKTTCCWFENVTPGTGNPDLGGNQELYCQTCSLVQGKWECDDAELQFLVGRTPGPLQGGVLQNDQPPLFGETPSGGAEQPPTLTPTQPLPGGSGTTEGGSTTQPRPPQTVTPEITEDDNEGGGLPTTESNKVPSTDNEITSEDDGQQEDSSEGAETAGPLT